MPERRVPHADHETVRRPVPALAKLCVASAPDINHGDHLGVLVATRAVADPSEAPPSAGLLSIVMSSDGTN